MNKKLGVLILFQLSSFVLGTILFIILFRLNLFLFVDTIFYRGIALLILTCIIMIGLLLLFKKSRYGGIIEHKDILMCLIMVFSFNLVIFALLPVTTDRSISVMILRNMDTQRSMSFTPYQLEDQLDKILSKKQAVAKRLHEQVVTGNIKKTPKGYKITAQGSYLVHLFSVIDTIFNTKK